MTTHNRRRIMFDMILVGIMLLSIGMVGLTISLAGAQDGTEIAIRVRHSEGYGKGDLIYIDTVTAPEGRCVPAFRSGNNTSIHEQNALLVRGDIDSVIPGVETDPGETFYGPVGVFAPTADVFLVMGESTIASLAGTLFFECEPTPTTTTTPHTHTTTSTTTTLPHIDTTTTTVLKPRCEPLPPRPRSEGLTRAEAALPVECQPDFTG